MCKITWQSGQELTTAAPPTPSTIGRNHAADGRHVTDLWRTRICIFFFSLVFHLSCLAPACAEQSESPNSIGTFIEKDLVNKFEHPDPAVLYQEYSQSLIPSLVLAQDPSIRTMFENGVNETISLIEKRLPVKVSCYGDGGSPPDREIGLSIGSRGCVVDDAKIDANDAGKIAALRWYAGKNVYAVNSLKRRMRDKIPANVRWYNFGQLDTTSGVKVSGIELGTNGIWLINESGQGKRALPFGYYEKNQNSARWAYDSETDCVWLDLAAPRSVPHAVRKLDAIRAIYLQSNFSDVSLPDGMTWHKFTQDSAVDSKDKYLTIALKPPIASYTPSPDIVIHEAGKPNLSVIWSYALPWQNSRWAYDKSKDIFWIDMYALDPPPRMYAQVDRLSGQTLGFLNQK